MGRDALTLKLCELMEIAESKWPEARAFIDELMDSVKEEREKEDIESWGDSIG